INAIANRDLVYTSPDKAAPKIPASGAPAPFMKLPASTSITVTRSTRYVSIDGDADPGVQIYRFELANAARLNWEVWAPPTGSASAARSFRLPDPGFSTAADCNAMTTLCDPFVDAKADDGTTHGPGARLLALQLTTADTAAKLETFSNALRLDELGASLKAFTALQVSVNQ
ncbi:MAG: hypothetical protein LC689_10845, partial [Myxococcales bacterium]|nr:hypothetical protein [Myxococcales bacterium]